MRKTIAVILALCAQTASGQSANGDPISPRVTQEQVQQAIDRGKKAKKWEGAESRSSWIASKGMGYHVTAEGPLNRVANAAAEHAKKYLPYTTDSVSGRLLDAMVTIEAYPWTPEASGGEWNVTANATHLVVLPRGGSDSEIMQPSSVETFPVSWGNASGGKFSGQGVRATLLLSVLPSVFEVRVVTEGKEYRIGFDERARNLIR